MRKKCPFLVAVVVLGAVLEALPTEDIREFSTMTRELCVELVNAGDGLERNVIVDFVFVPSLSSPYATTGETNAPSSLV